MSFLRAWLARQRLVAHWRWRKRGHVMFVDRDPCAAVLERDWRYHVSHWTPFAGKELRS